MSIEKINEAIKKVKTMQYGAQPGELTDSQDFDTFKQVRPLFDELKSKITAVWRDDDLTPQGKANKERELKAETAKELAKLVKTFQNIQQKELTEAEKIAKAIITKPDTKPDDFTMNEWQRRYDELKTDLTVFGSQSAAQAMLDFIRATDDSYLANIIVGDFTDIHGKLSKHYTNGFTLSTVYSTLKAKAAGDIKTEARAKLTEIERLKTQSPMNSMIGLAVEQSLGAVYQNVLINPENYLGGE